MSDDLFSGMYSERRVRFLLRHYDAWAHAGEYPAYARDALALLVREWDVLSQEHPSMDCYCRQLNDGIPSRAVIGTAAPTHAPAPQLVEVRADLAAASDGLPLHWRATCLLFALQGRARDWQRAFAAQRLLGLPRPREHRPEPPSDPALHWLRTGGGAACVGLMAEHLAWPLQQGVA